MIEKKQRLDQALLQHGLVHSRQRGRALIMAGKVLVNDQVRDKPATAVSGDDRIALKVLDIPYVSRGGLKLEKAIKTYHVDVNGLHCLDVGASTGGFTDCLLQHGADCVYAVDVGYGQLAWKLRQDPRVVVIERTNIRHMAADALPCSVDLVSIDVSFISLKTVVPAVRKFMKKDGVILALIKPQFEVGKGMVGKGGVVRDPGQWNSVITELTDFFSRTGLACGPVVSSPITGPKGNREFIVLLENLKEETF